VIATWAVFIVDCLGEMSYVCMTLMYYLLLRARALVVFGLVALVSRLAVSLCARVSVCVCLFDHLSFPVIVEPIITVGH